MTLDVNVLNIILVASVRRFAATVSYTQHTVCVSQEQTHSNTRAVCSLLTGGLRCAGTVRIRHSGSGQVRGAKVMGSESADQIWVWIRGCELDKSPVNTPADGGAQMHMSLCVSMTYCGLSTSVL